VAKLPGAYELMATAASPAINFGRGLLGYQDPFKTQTMQDRMTELESEKGPTGSIGYEDYGLQTATPGGRFTGGLFDLALNNPVDFGLAGSVGRYGFSPEGRTGLEYDFTPDKDTGSAGNALLDFINKGGVKSLLNPTETSIDPTDKNLFSQHGYEEEDEYDFSGIEGQTAGLGVLSGLKKMFGPKLGAYMFKTGKNKALGKIGKKVGPVLGGVLTGGAAQGAPGVYTGPKTYDFDEGQARREGRRADKPGGFTDPGKGSYGPHMAYGGRASYFDGGLLSLWPR